MTTCSCKKSNLEKINRPFKNNGLQSARTIQ